MIRNAICTEGCSTVKKAANVVQSKAKPVAVTITIAKMESAAVATKTSGSRISDYPNLDYHFIIAYNLYNRKEVYIAFFLRRLLWC